LRILNENDNSAISNITLMLTLEETKELRDGLNQLIQTDLRNNFHIHVDDNEYRHEITVAVYNNENETQFNDRIKKLIIDDK
jgi:hypothetical protein